MEELKGRIGQHERARKEFAASVQAGIRAAAESKTRLASASDAGARLVEEISAVGA